jgi:hypothetical protein
MRHFLLECPAHEDARRELRNKLGPRKAGDIRLLLNNKKAFETFYTYVDRTGSFHNMLGTTSRHDLHVVYG